MWWSNFRERVNLYIYNSKNTVLTLFRWSNFLVAFSMIGVLIYYYGFPQTPESRTFLTRIIELSFIFYTVRFLVKIIYEFNPLKFMRQHWIETTIVLLLIIEGISYNFFGVLLTGKFFRHIGLEDLTDFSNILIQLFFMTYIFVEAFKKRDFKQYIKIYPGLLFMLTLAGTIIVGTGLLMLPEMTNPGQSLTFLDSLFISTSSVSVTGLDSVGMINILSFKGEVVILFLIQIGALNTIAFGALYLLLAKFGVGLKQHKIIEDYVNESHFLDTEKMFLRIVKWVLIIELIGSVIIFTLLKPQGMLESTPSRIFHSVFHAVSSFCNAGISMLPDGMTNPLIVHNYPFHLVTFGLFFLGAFGMIYLFDLIGIKHIRHRMKYPWKSLRFDTKLSLYTTLILLVVAAVVFFFLENHGSMEGRSWFGKITTTIYNAMSPRATGLISVPFSSLSMPFLVFFLFLMFIGGSSGSTSGGIRVSTFAVVVSSVVSTIRRRPHVEILKRTIDNELVLRAYSILIFFMVGNLVGIFALSITEHAALESGQLTVFQLIFEHVAAASTVGTSSGVTPLLTDPGKVVIIIAMFIGRCGTLTVAYLFGRKASIRKYKYPKGHVMVG